MDCRTAIVFCSVIWKKINKLFLSSVFLSIWSQSCKSLTCLKILLARKDPLLSAPPGAFCRDSGETRVGLGRCASSVSSWMITASTSKNSTCMSGSVTFVFMAWTTSELWEYLGRFPYKQERRMGFCSGRFVPLIQRKPSIKGTTLQETARKMCLWLFWSNKEARVNDFAPASPWWKGNCSVSGRAESQTHFSVK